MAQKTNIEWTEMSVNPFRARDNDGHTGHHCEKLSPGCANCYASTMQARFQMPPYQANKNGHTEVLLDGSKLMDVLTCKKPTKFFWCDMTDMFLDVYPDEWILLCFAIAAMTPWHTHQFLTKRIARAQRLLTRWDAQDVHECAKRFLGYDHPKRLAVNWWPLPNVWLGVSVEDQATVDERIPLLLQTPAAVRWISAEPLLGPIDLADYLNPVINARHNSADLDWAVVGGESGAKARSLDIRWVRSIIQQCQSDNVPVFVKQLGAMAYESPGHDGATGYFLTLKNKKGGDMSEWPEDLRVGEWPV